MHDEAPGYMHSLAECSGRRDIFFAKKLESEISQGGNPECPRTLSLQGQLGDRKKQKKGGADIDHVMNTPTY